MLGNSSLSTVLSTTLELTLLARSFLEQLAQWVTTLQAVLLSLRNKLRRALRTFQGWEACSEAQEWEAVLLDENK